MLIELLLSKKLYRTPCWISRRHVTILDASSDLRTVRSGECRVTPCIGASLCTSDSANPISQMEESAYPFGLLGRADRGIEPAPCLSEGTCDSRCNWQGSRMPIEP